MNNRLLQLPFCSLKLSIFFVNVSIFLEPMNLCAICFNVLKHAKQKHAMLQQQDIFQQDMRNGTVVP